MITTFFFALLAIASAELSALCVSIGGDDDLTKLFADYDYNDTSPQSGSFSLSVNPDQAKASLEAYLNAIRTYLAAAPLSAETKDQIKAEVNARWAAIREAYNAASSIDQSVVRACVALKVTAFHALQQERDAINAGVFNSSYAAYKKYATLVQIALDRWQSYVASDSPTGLVAAQIVVQGLRVIQGGLDFLAFAADIDNRLYAHLEDGVNGTAAWFKKESACNQTCSDALEATLEQAALEVIYTRVAARRAQWLGQKLQADWQAILDNLKSLSEQIRDDVNREFPKAIERLKAIANQSVTEWHDRVDRSLEGLSCDTTAATITVTFPDGQLSFQVQGLTCTIDGKTDEEVDTLLCERIVALIAGSGATNPQQFTCTPTAVATKRSIQQTTTNVEIVGSDSAGAGLVATLTLLLVTLFFHFF